MPGLFEWSALKSIYRSLGLGLGAFFLLDCWLALHAFHVGGNDDLAEYGNGLALGLGLLLTLVIAKQHRAHSMPRLFWCVVSAGLLLMACNEIFDVGERMNRAWAHDDYIDLVMLGLTPIGLYLACRIEAAPRIAVTAMRLGFAFQCISALIDLGDGDLYGVTIRGALLMDVLTDISELIFIETYLFGLGCMLLHVLLRGMATGRMERAETLR